MATKIQLVFQDSGVIDTIVLDATIKESYAITADVTDFPVEEGSDIADNIRRKPDGLTIEGVVTDFPLKNDGRFQTSSGGATGSQRLPAPVPSEARSRAVLKTFEQWIDNGQLLQIETGLKRYKNMAPTSITPSRDKDTKNALRFSLTFKSVVVASLQTVSVKPVNEPKAKTKKPDGKKTGKDADTAQKDKRSIAKGRVDEAWKLYDKYKAGL